MKRPPSRRAGGFTLVELLAVLAIVALLAALALPALSSSRANQVTLGGNMITDTLNQAREAAMSRNRFVEVRFYEMPDASGNPGPFSALRLYIYDDAVATPTPLTRLIHLPQGIVMPADAPYSTLLADATNPATGQEKLPNKSATLSYKSFQLHPNGSTSLTAAGAAAGGAADNQWFVTVKADIDAAANGLPAHNFVTVEVNPVTGHVTTYHLP